MKECSNLLHHGWFLVANLIKLILVEDFFFDIFLIEKLHGTNRRKTEKNGKIYGTTFGKIEFVFFVVIQRRIIVEA